MEISAKSRLRLILIANLFFTFITPTSAQSGSAYNSTDPTSIPKDAASNANAQDLYGFGVRLGIYFQALAFIIGFGNVLRLDPKSQFSGVILAFTVLVRWFSRLRSHNISTSELWVGLALILIVAVPGMWLLFYTIEAQRLKLFTKYKYQTGGKRNWLGMNEATKSTLMEITKGQTLNILQALVVFIWAVVANSWFSYWIIAHYQGATYPPAVGTKNVIWLGTTVSVDSNWVKIFMVSQAAVGTAFTSFPTFVYVIAAVFSLKAYWFNGPEKPKDPITGPEKDSRSSLVHKRWAYSFGAGLLLFCVALIVSIELTLKHANLIPEMNVERPGQLLPLIAGSVSCVSAAADAFGRHIPAIHRELGSAPASNVGPFSDQRQGRSGSYVPLVDMHSGREYQRGSDGRVATPETRTDMYAESMNDVYTDGCGERQLRPAEDVYDNYREGPVQENGYGRTQRYEPYRSGPI